jgi:sec-independent protein translocase protein TatB
VNFLGIGPMELVLIVVLALIVFGPQELPHLMAQVGRFVAEAQRLSRQLSADFNQTLQTEIEQTRAAVAEPLEASRSILHDNAFASESRTVPNAQAPKPEAAGREPPEPTAAGARPATVRHDPDTSDVMPPY